LQIPQFMPQGAINSAVNSPSMFLYWLQIYLAFLD
jgi:hypothetical protein